MIAAVFYINLQSQVTRLQPDLAKYRKIKSYAKNLQTISFKSTNAETIVKWS